MSTHNKNTCAIVLVWQDPNAIDTFDGHEAGNAFCIRAKSFEVNYEFQNHGLFFYSQC